MRLPIGAPRAIPCHTSHTRPTHCVEVALNLTIAVPVRDSKRPAGPVLVLTHAAWAHFVTYAVRDH